MTDESDAKSTNTSPPKGELSDALAWLEERLERGLDSLGASLPGDRSSDESGADVADRVRTKPAVAVGAALVVGAALGLALRRILP